MQRESVVRAAATPNVRITEYSVLRYPHSPAIGPDGSVWFGGAGNESSTILFVYRFAANDGQGRFYALPSLMKPYPEFRGNWLQQGPLISFAGRMWISFNADVEPGAVDFRTDHEGGFVQMSPQGTALNATVINVSSLVGGAAVRGNSLWTLPTANRCCVEDGIRSFTFEDGALKRGPVFNMPSPDWPLGSLQLRAGPDGNIYALTLDSFDGVWKISPTATLLAKYQLKNFQPFDMAFGSDGAMWITTRCVDEFGDRSCTTPYIMRMTMNGTRALYRIPYLASDPTAITLGHDGAMWFVDAGTNAIGRITMRGAITEYPVPTRNAVTDPFNGNLNVNGIVACPINIAACGSGDIWFTEPNTSKLGRVHF